MMNTDADIMMKESKRLKTAKKLGRPSYTAEEVKVAESKADEVPTTRPKTTAALYGEMKEQ